MMNDDNSWWSHPVSIEMESDLRKYLMKLCFFMSDELN